MKKTQKRITALIFLLIVIFLPFITLVSKKENFSELENRVLSKKPEFSLENWFDKSFMNDFESYVSDHFSGREKWITKKIDIELMTGKKEINGVYITDDRLIEKIPEPDNDCIKRSVDTINNFAKSVKTPVYVLIAPTSAGIYSESLGKHAPQLDQKEIISGIYSGFNTNVLPIDVYEALYARKDEYIYYRTDHHWTSLGAYNAYNVTIQKMGFSAVAYSEYNIEHANDEFLGTYHSKTLYDKLLPDIIDIYSYTGGNSVVSCEVNNGMETQQYNSIYFRDFLEKKDKYSTYLGSNQPAVTIRTNLESDKKLLVFKDSYANSFIPFLTQHYKEITVLDMRYIANYKDYADPEEYSQILFLYNSTTFCSDDNIKKIMY